MKSSGITTTTPVRIGIIAFLQHVAEQHRAISASPLARAVRT